MFINDNNFSLQFSGDLQQEVENAARSCRIQISKGLIFLGIIDSDKLEFNLKIENYDAFDHISELILEEMEEYINKNLLFNTRQKSKFEECMEIDSVYSNYNWFLFQKQNYWILTYQRKQVGREIERSISKLSSLMNKLQTRDKSLPFSEIQYYLMNQLYKNKAISQLEED